MRPHILVLVCSQPTGLPLDEVTLPQVLKQVGYKYCRALTHNTELTIMHRTHAAGKWHLGFSKHAYMCATSTHPIIHRTHPQFTGHPREALTHFLATCSAHRTTSREFAMHSSTSVCGGGARWCGERAEWMAGMTAGSSSLASA